ncbi:ABC transporter permease [Dactylosporangium sp. NPDC005572]|uniref:ABC transporter permease n=1 Tax=Dactylosporangium sp. NPDC005572 TaxID=3156889 RepID=UPI0033B3874C
MSRILAIARLQALGRRDGLLWPLVIAAIAFSVNLLVFAAIGDEALDGTEPITGGLASIYIAALAFGAVAISQQFPFALGMSVTRREFAAGLGVFVFGQSLLYSVILTVCQAIENATDGWGMRLRFFGLGFIDEVGVPGQLAVYGVPMLAMSLIGVTLGTIHIHWKVNGVFATTAGLILVLGGLAALLTWTRSWPAIWRWLGDQPVLVLFGLLPLGLALALTLASWATLRRATA